VPALVNQRDTGTTLTVGEMMKSTTFLPRRQLSMFDQQWLTAVALRRGDPTANGLVGYFESTPLFIDDDPEVLDEFGEIPVVAGQVGRARVARAVRRAYALRVSKQAIDRNRAEWVNTQMEQLRNTMVRVWEDALYSAFIANPNLQTLATDTPWGSPDSHIRRDVNAAKFVIKTAAADAAGKQRFGFKADTLIISDETELDFLDSDEIAKVYLGSPLATQNLQYTGVLEKRFMGLDVFVSWRLNAYIPGGAMVLQRGIVGAISDERALDATPMYPEGGGGNGGPREAWRTDITRASAIAIDQPKAACIITGVSEGETFPASGSTVI
jgi:hypothetical protein